MRWICPPCQISSDVTWYRNRSKILPCFNFQTTSVFRTTFCTGWYLVKLDMVNRFVLSRCIFWLIQILINVIQWKDMDEILFFILHSFLLSMLPIYLEGWRVERRASCKRPHGVFRAAFRTRWHLKKSETAKKRVSSRRICVHLLIFSNVTQCGKQFEILNFVCSPFYCPPFHLFHFHLWTSPAQKKHYPIVIWQFCWHCLKIYIIFNNKQLISILATFSFSSFHNRHLLIVSSCR